MFDDTLPVLNCDNCGVCCSEIGVPPFVRHEIFDLPEELRNEVFAYEESEPNRENSKKPCYWWDSTTKKCTQYENRPQTCQDFEPGCVSCLSYRDYHNID